MGFQHGTSTGYNYHKCRCDECVAWKKATRQAEYERNRDKILARNKAYQQAHKEELAAKATERWHRNAEQYKEYHRQYRQTHAEEINAKNRAWRARRFWHAKALQMAQYCETKGQPLSPEAYEWIDALIDPECAYCGDPATCIDHVVPLSKGGPSVMDNLVPSCEPCNRSKHRADLADWLKRLRESGRARPNDQH